MTNTPRISVFPKCYFDELVSGRMDYVTWIHDAATLGGEGVEHYDEFFRSPAPEHVGPVLEAMRETGQITSLLCFSPNFTHPSSYSGHFTPSVRSTPASRNRSSR